MAIDRVAVREIHLRYQTLLLFRTVLQEAFDLIAQILPGLSAVYAAVLMHDQCVGLQNALHGSRRTDLSLLRIAVHQHAVKQSPLRGNRIAFFFTAQQKTAAFRIRLNIVHQGVPPSKMEKQKMIHLQIGAPVPGQQFRHIGEAFLRKPVFGVVASGQRKV